MPAVLRFTLLLALLPALHVSACPQGVAVSQAWVSEAPPGISTNAAYLKIENKTDKKMVLQNVTSPDYKRGEMHLSFEDEGIARMQLQSEIEIAANAEFEFAPGAYHVMLFGPTRKIQIGESVHLILQFAGEVQISVNAEVKRLTLEQSQHH